MKSKIHEHQKNNFKIVSKKLLVLALLIAGSPLIAQEKGRKHQGNEMEQFTPEQKSQLMLKKMTLELDLNEAQQKEVSVVISDKIAKMESHKSEMKANREKEIRPTKDERFAMKMKMFDEEIATKKRMEKILNAKQFEKWTLMKEHHQDKFQRKHKRNPQGRPQGK